MGASYKTSLIILTWTLFLLKDVECQAASVVISVNPTGGKITLGDSIRVQCSLTGARSNDSLLWYRRQGDIRYKLGTDNVLTLNNGNVGDKRYGLEQVENKDTTRTFRLTVTDAKLEDSAKFECRMSTDTSAVSAAVSVCSETSSQFCDCIASKGWASPECFTSQLNPEYAAAVESRWKEVVGLIIALCVMVAYSIVLFLVEKRDILGQCCTEEQQMEDERKLNSKPDCDESDRGQMEPSDSASDSATCSTSDPSSSGGSDAQGSNRSMPSSQSSTHRLVPDQQAEQEHWNRNQKPHKKPETTFIIKPEVHYDQGYVKVGEDHLRAEGNHERNIGHQQNYQADVLPPYHSTSPASGHGTAGGGQSETPFQHDLGNRLSPQPTRSESRINTISGSAVAYADPSRRNTNDVYSSQVLNPYASCGSLSVAGTEI